MVSLQSSTTNTARIASPHGEPATHALLASSAYGGGKEKDYHLVFF